MDWAYTIAVITLIVFVDVCGRYLLNKPMAGTYELVEEAMVILGGLAIMYAAVEGGHMAIDILAAKFSSTYSDNNATYLLTVGIWSLECCGLRCLSGRAVCDEVVPNYASFHQISPAPFQFILAAGLFLCSLTLLIQTFHPKVPEETMGKEEEMVNEP